MMRSIEDMIGDGPDADQFWLDCQAAFGDPQGQRLLAKLCTLCHPLGSPLRLLGQPLSWAGCSQSTQTWRNPRCV